MRKRKKKVQSKKVFFLATSQITVGEVNRQKKKKQKKHQKYKITLFLSDFTGF